MRLLSFRIRNCFGFVDFGSIDLDVPGNLVYFLGRNSSGKTSVLRAISFMEHDRARSSADPGSCRSSPAPSHGQAFF